MYKILKPSKVVNTFDDKSWNFWHFAGCLQLRDRYRVSNIIEGKPPDCDCLAGDRGGGGGLGHPDHSSPSLRSQTWWLSSFRSGCYGRILFIINKQVPGPCPGSEGKARSRSQSPESAKSISLVLFRPHSPSRPGPGLIGKTSFRILLSLI